MERAIPQLITHANNEYFTRLSQLEEIKNALYNMNGNYAPDPGGFWEWFLQIYWGIVGDKCDQFS